jgi:hypothetical protein
VLSFAQLWGVSPPFKSPVGTPSPWRRSPWHPLQYRVTYAWSLHGTCSKILPCPGSGTWLMVHGRTLGIQRELHGNSIAWWST